MKKISVKAVTCGHRQVFPAWKMRKINASRRIAPIARITMMRPTSEDSEGAVGEKCDRDCPSSPMISSPPPGVNLRGMRQDVRKLLTFLKFGRGPAGKARSSQSLKSRPRIPESC
jgi:hypothetical protein